MEILLRHIGAGALGSAEPRQVVVVKPEATQHHDHSAKRATVGLLAELRNALLKESAEFGAGQADGATQEVDPDQAAVKPFWARRDKSQDIGKLINQTHR